MKKITYLLSLWLCLLSAVLAPAQNRLKDKPTASAPAADDWLYLDGATNGVRKLSPDYFSGDVSQAGTNAFTGANSFTAYPRVIPSDLAGGTALTIGAHYRDTISAPRTLTFSGSPAEGSRVSLTFTSVSGAPLLGIPSSVRVGQSTTPITSLQLTNAVTTLAWEYKGATWYLTDSVPAGTVDASTALTGIVPSANGGAGTVNGILKANGSGTTSAATAGTDYLATTAIDNTAYNSTSWNGDTTHAPSKDAVRDIIETVSGAGVSDGDKGDVVVSGSGTAWTLDTSGVSAGSYTSANITVDAKGRVTAAANGSGGSGGYYTMNFGTSSTTSPADNNTYYVAKRGGNASTSTSSMRAFIPVTGTIVRVDVYVSIQGTLGTSESVPHYIRLNDTTDVISLGNATYDALGVYINATGLSQAVTAGDFITLKVGTTPFWVTNPTNIYFDVVVTIQN